MLNIIKFENFQEELEKAAFEVFQSLSEEELNEGSASGSVSKTLTFVEMRGKTMSPEINV